jgi:hypothetical protein
VISVRKKEENKEEEEKAEDRQARGRRHTRRAHFRAVPIRAVGRRVSLRVAPRSVAVVDRRARVVDGGVVGEGKCTWVTSRGGTSTFF